MSKEFILTTPVVFITYIRLDTAKIVFEQIRKAKPQKLYLISDGGKDEIGCERVKKVRDYIEKNIDWNCEVKKNYAVSNMGCRNRVQSGLSWVFKQEEQAIILEDDVVPSASFFEFCQEMLDYYKNDGRIMMITGNKRLPDYKIEGDYTFSRFCSIWGWATWRRAWISYDDEMSAWPKAKKQKLLKKIYGSNVSLSLSREFDMTYTGEINSWAYRWHLTMAVKGGLEIVPKYNLIDNIGQNNLDSTHSFKNKIDMVINDIEFPMSYQEEIVSNELYDKKIGDVLFKTSIFEKIIRYIVPPKWLKKARLFLEHLLGIDLS